MGANIHTMQTATSQPKFGIITRAEAYRIEGKTFLDLRMRYDNGSTGQSVIPRTDKATIKLFYSALPDKRRVLRPCSRRADGSGQKAIDVFKMAKYLPGLVFEYTT
jgi:hypothetical protein